MRSAPSGVHSGSVDTDRYFGDREGNSWYVASALNVKREGGGSLMTCPLSHASVVVVYCREWSTILAGSGHLHATCKWKCTQITSMVLTRPYGRERTNADRLG